MILPDGQLQPQDELIKETSDQNSGASMNQIETHGWAGPVNKKLLR